MAKVVWLALAQEIVKAVEITQIESPIEIVSESSECEHVVIWHHSA